MIPQSKRHTMHLWARFCSLSASQYVLRMHYKRGHTHAARNHRGFEPVKHIYYTETPLRQLTTASMGRWSRADKDYAQGTKKRRLIPR